MAKKKTEGHATESRPIYNYKSSPLLVSSQSKVIDADRFQEDEDEQDLALVNARIQAVRKGQSRLVTGQELKKRLDDILSS